MDPSLGLATWALLIALSRRSTPVSVKAFTISSPCHPLGQSGSARPPLVVKQGGLALPLCPSGWHGLEMVNAFTEAGVDHLLKAINKAHVAKSRDGSVDLELLDQLLH